MNVKIVNYTGLTLKLKWDTTHEVISCGSEKEIEIEQSKAKLTRFHAKYRSVPGSPVQVKGQINVIFESANFQHVLVLSAFIDGQPKCVGCINVNDHGKYLYTEYPRQSINGKYPYGKYYNIPIDLDSSTGFASKLKKIYYVTFNQSHCENRDGPLCDKLFGIPVLIMILTVLIVFVIITAIMMIAGSINSPLIQL